MRGSKVAFVALTGALMTGCGAGSLIMSATPVAQPLPGKVMVNFFRPRAARATGMHTFAVWDGEKVAGVIPNNSRLQYMCEPGKHHLFTIYDTLHFDKGATALEAEFEAGKTYDVLVSVTNTVWPIKEMSVEFIPIREGSKHYRSVPEWESSLRTVGVNTARATVYERKRLPKVIPLFAEISRRDRYLDVKKVRPGDCR